MGEIEYAIKAALPEIEYSAVDVIRKDSREYLIAFLNTSGETAVEGTPRSNDLTSAVLPMDDKQRQKIADLTNKLKATLPAYMVPQHFIPFQYMPFVTSMKLNRKKLREFADTLSMEELNVFALAAQVKEEPTTAAEIALREIWSRVLKISPSEIGKNDNFLQIGGDSITAIQMVTLATLILLKSLTGLQLEGYLLDLTDNNIGIIGSAWLNLTKLVLPFHLRARGCGPPLRGGGSRYSFLVLVGGASASGGRYQWHHG